MLFIIIIKDHKIKIIKDNVISNTLSSEIVFLK